MFDVEERAPVSHLVDTWTSLTLQDWTFLALKITRDNPDVDGSEDVGSTLAEDVGGEWECALTGEPITTRSLIRTPTSSRMKRVFCSSGKNALFLSEF